VVICLERGADLHTAQLPLTVSCVSKIQIAFTFLVPAHPGSPGQRAVKRVCVYVYIQPEKLALLRGIAQPARKCRTLSSAKMDKQTEMQFRQQTQAGLRNHALDGGTHWRHLVNMTERSVHSGDAASCQITRTTCYYY